MIDDKKPPRSENPMQSPAHRAKADAKLDREVQAKIGQQLRSMYDEVVNQGIPDRFSDLLNRLQTSQGDEGSKG
jgi:hypothetical protein